MNTVTEVWADIPDYEGYYQISSFGRVKALPRLVWNGRAMAQKSERILKQSKTYCGGKRKKKHPYYVVNLSKENVKKHGMIHRLVAKAFVPNPNNMPQVNHLDRNTLNNIFTNLEWTDNSGNQKHRYETGDKHQGGIKGKSNRRSKPVYCYSQSGTLIKTYDSLGHAAEELSIHRSGISNCIAGRCPTYAGYIWKR